MFIRWTEAIRSAWKCVSRCCQIYLAAGESVIKKLPSGQTVEASGGQVMELYCLRARVRDRAGIFRGEAVFQHVDSTLYLISEHKWGAGLTLDADERGGISSVACAGCYLHERDPVRTGQLVKC